MRGASWPAPPKGARAPRAEGAGGGSGPRRVPRGAGDGESGGDLGEPIGRDGGAGAPAPPGRGRLRAALALARGVAEDVARKQLSLVAAGVAFYGMLALFPALTAFAAIWGLFADPAAVRDQLDALGPVLPDDVRRMLSAQLVAAARAKDETAGWAGALSLALSLWSARAGTGAVIKALNAVHEAPSRGGVGHYLAALGLTAALIVLGVLALTAIVIAPLALALLPLGPAAALAAEAARWALAAAVMTAGVGLTYRFGPNRRGRRLPWITWGAAAAILLWIAASAGFSLYLSQFGAYGRIYGALGAVVAMLMWLYLSAFALLLGAAIDARLERIRAPRP